MLQSRSLCSRARKKSDDLTTAIVLAGTSFPASAGADLHSLRGGLLVRPSKLSSIDPHAMQDHGEPAGECYLGKLGAAPFGNSHSPATQGWPAAVMHEHMGRLIKRGTHHLVTTAADMTVIIDLSGTMATWREAKMSPHVARACEPLRHIDAGPICERHDHSDTRCRHQSTTHRIAASRCPRHAVKTAELIQEYTAHAQQRL